MNPKPLAPLSKSQRWLLGCVCVLVLFGTPFIVPLILRSLNYLPMVSQLGMHFGLLAGGVGIVLVGFTCGFLLSRLVNRNSHAFFWDGVGYGIGLSFLKGMLMVFTVPFAS